MNAPLRRAAGLLMVVAVVLGGCGLGSRSQLPAPEPAVVFPGWKGCAEEVSVMDLFEANDRPEQGRIPQNFIPVQAVRCERGGGDTFRGVERRADDIDGLIAELARPSEVFGPLAGSRACLSYGWMRPWLFLLDADGNWVMPQVPADACGHPLHPEDGNLLPTWRQYDEWPLDQSERRRLIKMGCYPRVIVDAILTDTEVGNDHRATIPATEFDGEVTAICRYRIGPRLHPVLQPEGHLEAGRQVTPADRERIMAAIIAVPADRCHETATTFVILRGIGDWIEIAVELDGCRRMLETYSPDGPHRAGDATEQLIALVRE